MYKILRPLLFSLSPEKAHKVTLGLLSFALAIPGMKWVFNKLFTVKHPSLEREVFGLKFPNPVGLAAGFDKEAKHYEHLGCFGFGFFEIGTITPKPQDGNPQPRLFRLPQDQGLINRMGFNNAGLEAAVERLKHRNPNLIVGGNIGKNKVTPNEEAVNDYIICFEGLFPYVDYFVVNVSSPNTPGLRELQEKEPLTHLLKTLQGINNAKPKRKPILLKIAPDLTDSQLDDIIAIVQETQLDGLIATNTTIDRSNLTTDTTELASIGAGGLSGKPLRDRSIEVVRYLHQKSGGSFPIIGVGGIMTAADAKAMLDAGAVLVQLYTGFIYGGPGIVGEINKGLVR
ncbi:quinone-dependent dihydroorotate dehydrogenase [soil metagenome]